jgi:type II secretion system protein C
MINKIKDFVAKISPKKTFSVPVEKSYKVKNKKISSQRFFRLVDELFQTNKRPVYNTLFVLACFVVVSYEVGTLTALLLKGKMTFEAPRVSARSQMSELKEFNSWGLNQVKTANLFKTNTQLGSLKEVAETKCEKSDEESSLPIKLVNTIVLQDSIKSIASVQMRNDKELKEFREGEEINNMAKIFKIERLQVIIKNLQSGTCEYLANNIIKKFDKPINVLSKAASALYKENLKKMKGIENVGNKFMISKELLDEKLKDIAGVLTQARAIKIQNPDGTLSFKITEIDPGGIFSYLGIQDSDIITNINGKPITDINEVMNLFGRLKGMNDLKLGIKRDGEDSNFEYELKK